MGDGHKTDISIMIINEHKKEEKWCEMMMSKFYIDENECPENALRLDCDEGFSTELVNSLKWMPVVSRMPCFN